MGVPEFPVVFFQVEEEDLYTQVTFFFMHPGESTKASSQKSITGTRKLKSAAQDSQSLKLNKC